MDVPSRKPDFNALFPNKTEFTTRLVLGAALQKDIEKHSATIRPADNEKIYEDFLTDQTQSIPPRFSSRALGHLLLRSGKYTIVDSAKGRIEDLLLTPPGADLRPRHVRHYRSLIDGLDDNRHYTVVCHPNNVQTIRSWFNGRPNVTFSFVLSPVFRYSIWAQDAYIAAIASTGTVTLIEGISFPRYEDMTLADDIAIQTDVAVLQSLLYFQGGNILGGSEYTLIGKDYVWRNTTRVNMLDEVAVVKEFEAVLGTEVRVLGGVNSASYEFLREGIFSGYGQQPLFHIDMYVTPTGKIGASGKEVVLFGRPSAVKAVVGRYSEMPTVDGQLLDSYFDETEAQLERDFEVQHLPLCLTRGNLGGQAGKDDYYWLTFNNVVIETVEGGQSNVFLTTYSGDAREYNVDERLRRDLETAAADTWANLGFEVHLIDGMEDLAYGLGSVHCITKDLRRSVPAVGQ